MTEQPHDSIAINTPAETAPEADKQTDPAMLNVLMAALRENPVCGGLNEDELLSIAEEAIESGKVSDGVWLAQKVAFLKGQEYDPSQNVTGATAGAEEGEGGFQLDEIIVSERALIATREDLDPILESHRAWMDSVLNPNAKIAGGRANLSEANLEGFDLQGVDLRGANLKGVNLTQANLGGANLSTADLTGANLSGAQLMGTKLRKAVLTDALFVDAHLKSADLRRAEWKGADFSGVDASDVICDADLLEKLSTLEENKPEETTPQEEADDPEIAEITGEVTEISLESTQDF